MQAIVSYYPSSNKIFNVYNTVEEAKSEIRLLNVFSSVGGEKLSVGYAEMTEEEYNQYQNKIEE